MSGHGREGGERKTFAARMSRVSRSARGWGRLEKAGGGGGVAIKQAWALGAFTVDGKCRRILKRR